MVIDCNDEQFLKVESSIFVTPSGILALVSLEQPLYLQLVITQ